MARFRAIPSTAVSASLFGTFGGFENVYAQYGGVFYSWISKYSNGIYEVA